MCPRAPQARASAKRRKAPRALRANREKWAFGGLDWPVSLKKRTSAIRTDWTHTGHGCHRTVHRAEREPYISSAATRAAAISSLHSRLASAQPRHNARYLSREANLRELRRAQPRHNRAARWPVQQPRRARSCHCVPHMHHAVTSLGGFASCVRGVAITPQQRSGSSRWNTRAAANRSTAARGPAGGCSDEVLAAILYGETATPAK